MAFLCVLLVQVRSRAIAGEGSAADALAQVVELQQQLEATKEQVQWWASVLFWCMQGAWMLSFCVDFPLSLHVGTFVMLGGRWARMCHRVGIASD